MQMRIVGAALVLALCTLMGGCATIVHGGPRAISVASAPPGAKVSIFDRDNTMVLQNTTPFVAQLSTKYRYFKGQEYRVVFEMPGHAKAEVSLSSSLSGWYFGNLVLGGLIGLLIVDPLTGAMYNLTPEKIDQPLTASQARIIRNGDGFLVMLAAEASESERRQMVRLN